MYLAVRPNERDMTGAEFYSDINWAQLGTIVGAFKDRLQWYYLDAADSLRRDSRQFDNVIAAISCMLIDTLSQFHFGAVSGTRTDFMNFLSIYTPALNGVLPTVIEHLNNPAQGVKTMSRWSDVIYRGFRCGILHEANIFPYGALWSGAATTNFELVGLSEYDGAHVPAGPCPTVYCNAWLLCDSVRAALNDYCNRVLNPNVAFDFMRQNFKDKFKRSFGVDINAAVL